jgi:metal-responsive CopG/Arc/MetJ family transcriptional regulator
MKPKRGRPRAHEAERKVRVSLMLDPDLLAIVDALAAAAGTSRCGAIRAAIRAAVQLEPQEPENAQAK